jgi:hypothetical protein
MIVPEGAFKAATLHNRAFIATSSSIRAIVASDLNATIRDCNARCTQSTTHA